MTATSNPNAGSDPTASSDQTAASGDAGGAPDRSSPVVQLADSAWTLHRATLTAEFPTASWLVVGSETLQMVAPDGTATDVEWDDATADVAWIDLSAFRADSMRRLFRLTISSATPPAWVHSSAAGTDAPIWQSMRERGSMLSGSHLSGVPISEYVIGQVLQWFRRSAGYEQARATKTWDSGEFREIHGSRWVVVGLGSIGGRVADLATAFGAEVVGVRATPRGDEPWPTHALSELPDLVGDADVIAFSLPATGDTVGLVDASFLDRCKDDAVIVNVGRGSLIVEDDLRIALDDGRLGGAILDVTETEPLPEDHWLWEHPLVALTPHGSATSTGRFDRCRDRFVANLHLWMAGDEVPHTVR